MNTSIRSRFTLGLSTKLGALALLGLVIGSLAPSIGRAQAPRGINSDGRDFYLGMMPGIPHQASSWTHTTESDYILIGSYQDNNQVTIHYFTSAGSEVVGKQLILSKGMCVQVPIDHASMFPTRQGERLEYKSAHITSDFPISVQYYSDGSSSGGMYQAIPTAGLGKGYVIAAFNDNPLRNNPGSINRDSSSSEFMIIAAYDNTVVTFTPNSTTFSGITGVNSGAGSNGTAHPVTVTMMRGQIYWVRSNPQDISDDMSGSTVVSNKPVAVLGGQERALLSDPSIWPTLDNDIRDIVVEEMTPVQDWGSDYPSIPTMPSSNPHVLHTGDGDMYRVYTNDPGGTAVNRWEMDPSYGPTLYGPYPVNLYQSPAEEFDNIMNPVDMVTYPGSNDASGSPKKFYAVEYQYFQGHHDSGVDTKTHHGKGVTLQSSGGDSPLDEQSYRSDNEMNLVSVDRWRLSCVFMVPKNSFYNGYQFIGVITNKDSARNIFITRNNSTTGNLLSYTPTKTYQIPEHPELIGYTIKMPPGSYVITGNTPFICYSYGRAETVYKDIWGYAAPTGQAYGSRDQSYTPKADVFPSCGDWDIRLHESVGKDPGIADVMLLNDPSGFYSRPPRVSTNCRLISSGTNPNDPTSPPFVVGDTSLEFHVQVADPSKDAYAAIYVVDVAGNDTVIQLYYTAPKVSISTKIVTFPDTMVGMNESTHITVHITSTGNFPSIQMPPAVLHSTDTSNNFSVTSIPTLPATLKPGDSVVFTISYTPADTNFHIDSLELFTGCINDTIPVKGRGRTPIILAQDWDFGNVTVGNTQCKDIPVQNIGNWPLILDKNYFLHLNPDYTFNGTVPVTIPPGGKTVLNFCFHPSAKGPSDSRMDWGTNLPGIYAHQKKDTSQLLGYGIAPGLSWDPHNQAFNVECQDTEIIRVHLVNISTGTEGADLSVTDLHVIGDPGEFSILRTQQSPNTVPWQLLKGDSQWVDLQFAPNLNNGFGNRLAGIVANGTDNAGNPYTDTLSCVAFIRHAIVTINPQSYNFGDQTPNTKVTQAFTITNSGDTAFVFMGLNLTGPDFTILSGPKIGDNIPVGVTDTIVVQFTANQAGGASLGILDAIGDHSFCSEGTDTITGFSLSVSVAEKTPNYPTTYICHNAIDSVGFTNTGTVGMILDSVQIVDSSAFPNASSQFAFSATDSQLLILNPLALARQQAVKFPVLFTPSIKDSVASVAIFFWEDTSKGQRRYVQDRQPITGVGYQTENKLSIKNPSAPLLPYSAVTANELSLPIQLRLPFDNLARIYGIEFTLRYYRDAFEYQTVTPAAGFNPANVTRTVDPSDNNYELLQIHLGSNSPILDSGAIATVNWKYVVAKDSVSPFQIENPMFLDSTGAQACWVAELADSASFYGMNTCGDATLREYLHGGTPAFSIGEIVPNPMNQSANVDFFVAQDGVPVTMQVYNALGEPVQTMMKDEPHAKGGYRLSIDASQLPSGLYTIFLSSPGLGGVSKQMLVTKF